MKLFIPGTTTSDSGFRFRRISDSLQDLSLGPLFPYLAEIESQSEFSFVDTESEDEDRESDYASPLSSRSDLPLDLDQHIENILGDFVENEETTMNSENVDPPEVIPFFADEDEP